LLDAIPHLDNLFRAFRNEHAAVIVTPTPLSAAELAFYTKSFTLEYFPEEEDATLELSNVVDPSIVGGYILTLDGSTTIDKSYKSQLKRAEEREISANPASFFAADRSLAPRFF
jgi:F0F1-type ATP synthase delta subunit